jgi:hypothetical protein
MKSYTWRIKKGEHRSVATEFKKGQKPHNFSHGLSNKIPEYKVWKSMRTRCNNPNEKAFKNYGGRGITVCERWNKFQNFIDDMGRRPTQKHTIDRIDNNLGYSPDNCRWVTKDVQANNTRTVLSAKRYTFNEKTMRISEWSTELGIPRLTLHARINKYGWSVEKAFTTPLMKNAHCFK